MVQPVQHHGQRILGSEMGPSSSNIGYFLLGKPMVTGDTSVLPAMPPMLITGKPVPPDATMPLPHCFGTNDASKKQIIS